MPHERQDMNWISCWIFCAVNFLIDNPSSIFFCVSYTWLIRQMKGQWLRPAFLTILRKSNDRGRLLTFCTGILKTLAGKGLLLTYSIVDMYQIWCKYFAYFEQETIELILILTLQIINVLREMLNKYLSIYEYLLILTAHWKCNLCTTSVWRLTPR